MLRCFAASLQVHEGGGEEVTPRLRKTLMRIAGFPPDYVPQPGNHQRKAIAPSSVPSVIPSSGAAAAAAGAAGVAAGAVSAVGQKALQGMNSSLQAAASHKALQSMNSGFQGMNNTFRSGMNKSLFKLGVSSVAAVSSAAASHDGPGSQQTNNSSPPRQQQQASPQVQVPQAPAMVISSGNMYALKERSVAVESLMAVAEELHRARAALQAVLPPSESKYIDSFYRCCEPSSLSIYLSLTHTHIKTKNLSLYLFVSASISISVSLSVYVSLSLPLCL